MTTPTRPRLISRLAYAASRIADLARRTGTPPERGPERLGQPSEERPKGLVLWAHAASPASAGAVAALIQELSNTRGEPVAGLVTTDAAGDPVPRPLLHQLAPTETRGSVRRFLEHWRPDAGVFIGAPDRPFLISEARATGIPLFLVASARGQIAPDGRLAAAALPLIPLFQRVLLPSAAEANAIGRSEIDRDRVQITGPLSDTVLPPPCSYRRLDALAARLAGRPVWLAADVALDEIPVVEAAQRHTIRAAHRLLLLIVPLDPENGPGIAQSLEEKGWRTGLLSRDRDPDETVQVFVADTRDPTAIWYRLAPITYLGGSFDPARPVSDPFLPASLGSAVIHGPEHGGATARIARLASAGATLAVDTPGGLGEAVLQLLSPDKAAQLAHAGWSVTSESAQVVERLAAMIDAAFDTREKA